MRSFKNISFRCINQKNTTLIRYFLSYFIILSVLFISFFLTVKKQFSSIYFEDINAQTKQKLEYMVDTLNNNLLSINQVHNSLISNINIILSRYSNTDWYQYLAAQKINEYTLSNTFIDSIVYLNKENGTVLSSGNYVKYSNDTFYIYEGTEFTGFQLSDSDNVSDNQLAYLGNNCLLYLPRNASTDRYTVFYIISSKAVKDTLNKELSDTVLSMTLLDNQGKNTIGIQKSLLAPYIKHINIGETTDVYSINSETSIYINSGVCNGFSLVSLISNEAILNQVNTAFSRTYRFFVLIAFIGLLLIMGGMNFTYLPLYRLTKKIVKHSDPYSNFLQQLDHAFSSVLEENQLLQSKIDDYRVSMQKSILDSIVIESSGSKLKNIPDIDQLFTMQSDNLIFVIHIAAPNNPFPTEEIIAFFDHVLPEGNSCILLESSETAATFLMNYSGGEQNKEDVLILFLNELFEKYGFKSAISNGSSTPLEIPALYENAVLASNYWEKSSVISYNDISSDVHEKVNFSYPHRTLEEFSLHLKNHNFLQVKPILDDLFGLINNAVSKNKTLPVFFIRCILIDIITAVITAMNGCNIKFKSYSDLYFETLFLCRSCSYEEESEKIYKNILSLIQTFETHVQNCSVDPAQIRKLMNDNYTSPDLSISSIADTFHVSVAYMSYIFKKEFHKNFSDYLWELRLKKAQQLLSSTDMSIETISLSVGYINSSSFRRKFKQETGQTPSQYRDFPEK